jgi:hypothetical protein
VNTMRLRAECPRREADCGRRRPRRGASSLRYLGNYRNRPVHPQGLFVTRLQGRSGHGDQGKRLCVDSGQKARSQGHEDIHDCAWHRSRRTRSGAKGRWALQEGLTCCDSQQVMYFAKWACGINGKEILLSSKLKNEGPTA